MEGMKEFPREYIRDGRAPIPKSKHSKKAYIESPSCKG